MNYRDLRAIGIGIWKRKSRRGARSTHVANLLSCESLEPRMLMSGPYRSFDGTGNNFWNPDWGSAEEAFLRISAEDYFDYISAPAGADRPSPRVISNQIVAQGDQDILNDRNLSAFVYAWGQFLDHDIDLTANDSTGDPLPIDVPDGDFWFDPWNEGGKTIDFIRSAQAPGTGSDVDNPRQQVNSVTAFIDGSQIYGSSAARAAALRTFVGGKLKTSPGNLLPFNTMGLENQSPPGADPTDFFVAGDIRANENIELTALHTLFLREHNRLATEIGRRQPRLNDEEIFQSARKIVIAELQAITYNEFLPAILGANALSLYRGYRPTVNPGILNEFATAAFRFGHSMLGADVEFLDNRGEEVRPEVPLRDAFFAPGIILSEGIDEILKYLASDPAQQVDPHIVDDVRNFLFGPPGSGGFDLASLNIQRGRDHGLASYNATRVAYGFVPVTRFDQITSDVQRQQALESTYDSVDDIDLWVGGLAEDHVPGASFGPLFRKIIATQFERLRDGDRFWYEREFRGLPLLALRSTTLAQIIRNNTTTWNLQSNVFEFRVEIAGRVVTDFNRNGFVERFESGVEGITVELVDLSGQVVASTTSDARGNYRFTGIDLGTYQVRIVVPAGLRMTTRPPATIELTRGMVVEGINFGLAPTQQQLAQELVESWWQVQVGRRSS